MSFGSMPNLVQSVAVKSSACSGVKQFDSLTQP